MEHPGDATTRSYDQVKGNESHRAFVFYKNFVAGGVAGAVSRTAVSPLERAKILFQVQNSVSIAQRGGDSKKGFDSLAATFARILKEDGIFGLFKGNGANILRIIPYSSMQFATYDSILRNVIARDRQPETIQTWERLTAGGCAGIAAATFTYPLDLARTRLSLSTNANPPQGVINVLRQVHKNEGGFLALYRGLGPTLLGIAPLVAINFTTYETLKQVARKLANQSEVSIPTRLACGAISGAMAQTVTYPLDVIRRRLQSSGLLGFKYAGAWDALKRIYTEEGPRSFYRGILPNYLKMVPAISISFVVYETMQGWLG